MTKAAKRAIEGLVADARAKILDSPHCGMAPSGVLARTLTSGWSLLLGIFRHHGIEHWHLSAKLDPPGRSSSNDDWTTLGWIIARVTESSGTPQRLDDIQPLTPFESTHPNAVHHWAWHADGSSLDPVAEKALRGILGAVSSAREDIASIVCLLERVIDAEASLCAVSINALHADKNLAAGIRALGAASGYAKKHGFADVAESLTDLRPLFDHDVERGCALLRELRISLRVRLDAATDAAGLPRVPPARLRTHAPMRTGPKVGRNAPCPCGSGKKYKKCCGAPAASR